MPYIQSRLNEQYSSGEPVILASASPRRKEILERLHIPFYSVTPPFDEELPSAMMRGSGTRKATEYLAVQKALSTARTLENTAADMQTVRFIVAADTLIVFRGKIYGKPKNETEARAFLRSFSGKTHTVYSGLAVYNRETQDYFSCTCKSRVTFAKISEQELEHLLGIQEWKDAAGAYKIQGIASCFIKRISGSYSSIMGLPIFEFYEILKKSGYRF